MKKKLPVDRRYYRLIFRQNPKTVYLRENSNVNLHKAQFTVVIEGVASIKRATENSVTLKSHLFRKR